MEGKITLPFIMLPWFRLRRREGGFPHPPKKGRFIREAGADFISAEGAKQQSPRQGAAATQPWVDTGTLFSEAQALQGRDNAANQAQAALLGLQLIPAAA